MIEGLDSSSFESFSSDDVDIEPLPPGCVKTGESALIRAHSKVLNKNSRINKSVKNLCNTALVGSILSKLKPYFLKTEEEKSLDEYIAHSKADKLMMEYFVAYKYVSGLLAIVIFSLVVVYVVLGLHQTEKGYVFVMEIIYLQLYFTTWFLIIHLAPKMSGNIVSISIFVVMVTTARINTGGREYVLTEYMITSLTFIFILFQLCPNNWKANVLAYGLGSLYFHEHNRHKYETIAPAVTIACIVSTVYVTVANYLMYSKFRTLYRLLFQNETLLNEIKRLLRVFPEAVIIQSSTQEGKREITFKNQEFENIIADLNKNVEELSSVNIRIESDKTNLKFSSNLCELIKKQERKLKKANIVEQHKVKFLSKSVEENSFFVNDGTAGDEIPARIFNIKSLRVDWAESKNAIMHVFIDTTSLYRLEEANTSIRWQKIMFASASHEFRTPLNAIINSYSFIKQTHEAIVAEIYRQEQISRTLEKQIQAQSKVMQKFISMGSKSSELLCALIEDVLNLSKIEAGTFKLHLSTFKIDSVVQEVYDIFKFQCDQKGIDLQANLAPEVRNKSVISDKNRIKQILLNLLSNSFKFTFQGYIHINARIVNEHEIDYVEFTVKDSGVGVKKKDIGKLFKLFGMIEHDKDQLNPHGCGIGLTVCKKYVEYMGGSIRLESEFGQGTQVIFTIELNEVETGESSKNKIDTNQFSEKDRFVDPQDFDEGSVNDILEKLNRESFYKQATKSLFE